MIGQFTLRLLVGISLMWILLPRGQVASGFFRIQMLLTLGLSVLLVLVEGNIAPPLVGEPLLSPVETRALFIGCAMVSFLGSILWTLERRQAATLAAGTVFLLSGWWITISSACESPALAHAGPVLVLASAWTSAALLGSAMTGMLIGHWHLTAPAMSLHPLSRLNLTFGLAAAARLAVAVIALPAMADARPGPLEWTWMALRFGAGLLVPLLLAVMVWRILKYKNTQSATGVLFVGVIVTFIGEMTAMLLERTFGLPV